VGLSVNKIVPVKPEGIYFPTPRNEKIPLPNSTFANSISIPTNQRL